MTEQTESRSRACMTYAEVKPVIDEVNDGANREQKSCLHDLCRGEARYRRSQ